MFVQKAARQIHNKISGTPDFGVTLRRISQCWMVRAVKLLLLLSAGHYMADGYYCVGGEGTPRDAKVSGKWNLCRPVLSPALIGLVRFSTVQLNYLSLPTAVM